MTDQASIAVWDVPLPVVAGERFAIKVGVKTPGGTPAAGAVEICDGDGKLLASGQLGREPWPGTEALYWVALELPSPPADRIAEFTVRAAGTATRFSVMAAAKPVHSLTIEVTERAAKTPLAGVEVRLGAFHGRTDGSGRVTLKVCGGDYQLVLWKAGHEAEPLPIRVAGDSRVAAEIVHVPEEHPDARWVR